MSLAPRLRESDIEEIYAASGWPVDRALAYAFNESDLCWVAVDRESVELAFGVSFASDGEGWVWMLAARSAMRPSFWRVVDRCSGPVLDTFGLSYKVLKNYVLAKNRKTLSWLKKQGFDIHPPAPWGAQGQQFCLVEYRG